MKNTNLPEFTQLITNIMIFYKVPIRESDLNSYWKFLKSYELTDIKKALHRHIVNPDGGQFLPKPADVIRYMTGGNTNQAMRAWSKVIQAIKHAGAYESLVFDDALIHAVINDLGGWIKICLTSDRELPFLEKNFIQRYCGYLLNPPATWLRQLTGIHEHQNSLNGFMSDPPILCGDFEKARVVYHGGVKTLPPPCHRLASLQALLIAHSPTVESISEKTTNLNHQQQNQQENLS